MKKVLIIFNQPAPYKVDLFNELSKKCDLDVIFERQVCSNRDKKFYALNKYNFNVQFLKYGAFGEENSYSGELKEYIKNNHQKYDLIIMNGYSQVAEIRAIHYMNKHQIKWVLMINGGLVKKGNFIKDSLKRSLISSAAYYISPCKMSDEYLIHYGAKEDKIYHFPNSTIYKSVLVDMPLSKNLKMELREKFNLPTYCNIFICPTQFIKRKNNIELLEAFKTRDDFLLLIGNGKEKKKYENFIKKNHMNNVIIKDFILKKDIMDYYACSDFFITLSKEDIYGHTVNEAMSQGIPVISTDKVVSASHLIKNGINGFIVPLHNKKALNQALDNISPSMALEALKTARENTIEKMSSAIIKIIEEINL